MIRIVFVDDEQHVLDGLKHWFDKHQGSWQTHFLDSASNVVTLLENQPIDCIVSGVSMPGMNGAELLSHIAQHYPDTVRVAFSATEGAELTLESLHATHRFVAKSEGAEQVNRAIVRSFELREQLHDPTLRTLITGITTLPVLPEIYDRLMLELASEDFSIDVVCRIIESDISLSATLLKVVNSPYYGLVRHVESPTHAVNLLGIEVVKNILLSEKVVSQFQQFSPSAERVSTLNIQASIRGVLANRFARLAKLAKRQVDHCQMAGMLSSLGELVIETRMVDANVLPTQEHIENLVGSSILGLWSLPDTIVEAVLHQNDTTLPIGDQSAMHVLHAIRHLEAAFTANDNVIGDNFDVQNAFAGYPQDEQLLEKWFDCFCDYHLDLKQAA